MAISSIPPLSIAPVLSPQQMALQGALQTFVPPVLPSPATPTDTVPGAATGQQLLASLEQALFRDLLGSARTADLTSIAPDIVQMVTGQLGASIGVGGDFLPLPLRASPASSMLLAASLASVFEGVQLLGGGAGEERGSLLDVLA